jgi:hypothetical protein
MPSPPCAPQADPAHGTCPADPDRVVLLVELNVAFALAAEDASVLPAQEARVRTLGGFCAAHA